MNKKMYVKPSIIVRRVKTSPLLDASDVSKGDPIDDGSNGGDLAKPRMYTDDETGVVPAGYNLWEEAPSDKW